MQKADTTVVCIIPKQVYLGYIRNVAEQTRFQHKEKGRGKCRGRGIKIWQRTAQRGQPPSATMYMRVGEGIRHRERQPESHDLLEQGLWLGSMFQQEGKLLRQQEERGFARIWFNRVDLTLPLQTQLYLAKSISCPGTGWSLTVTGRKENNKIAHGKSIVSLRTTKR